MSSGVRDIRTNNGGPEPFPLERTVEAYGVRLALGASDEGLFDRVAGMVPPHARPCDAAVDRFGLVRDEAGYRVVGSGLTDVTSADPTIAAGLLDAAVRAHLARHAPDLVFVHAGVVAMADRAIVIPGPSMSGKTTLVSELIRAGAVYYSEEYAVLDRDGAVHPYPKPLSLRAHGDVRLEELGAVAGEVPARAAVVAVTRYAAGSTWRPRRLSPGQAVLAVLSHTLVARERPEESLRAATRLVADAAVLQGERGEASAVAPALLDALNG